MCKCRSITSNRFSKLRELFAGSGTGDSVPLGAEFAVVAQPPLPQFPEAQFPVAQFPVAQPVPQLLQPYDTVWQLRQPNAGEYGA